MAELSMLDMNSLNAIAGSLRGMGLAPYADALISIQMKVTEALLREEHSSGLTFSKTVNVTNLKNVLCQVPGAVVSDWGLKVGDRLELIYRNGEITIRPHVQRRSSASEESDGLARATDA